LTFSQSVSVTLKNFLLFEQQVEAINACINVYFIQEVHFGKTNKAYLKQEQQDALMHATAPLNLNWHSAVQELSAPFANSTWTLVPLDEEVALSNLQDLKQLKLSCFQSIIWPKTGLT